MKPEVHALASALYDDKGKPSNLLKTVITHLKDRFKEILRKWPEAAAVKVASSAETTAEHSFMKFEVSWPMPRKESDAERYERRQLVDAVLGAEARLVTPTMAKAGFSLAPDSVSSSQLKGHFRLYRQEAVGFVTLQYLDYSSGQQRLTAQIIFHSPDTLSLLDADGSATGLSEASWQSTLRKLFSASEAPLRERFLASHRGTWERALSQTLKAAGEPADSRVWLTSKEWADFAQAYARLWGIPQGMRLALVTGPSRNTLVYDESRLERDARQWAADTVDALSAKVNRKVQMLDAVTRITAPTELTFLVVGERGGHAVVLEQTVTYNMSSKGTPYLQFPARFTVNGKALSEAKYKAMFSDPA